MPGLFQAAHVYLLEDGLELWLTVAKNMQYMNQELLQIYKNIPVLLERASETLPTCLSITRMYLLIDAKAFLQVWLHFILHLLFRLM